MGDPFLLAARPAAHQPVGQPIIRRRSRKAARCFLSDCSQTDDRAPLVAVRRRLLEPPRPGRTELGLQS